MRNQVSIFLHKSREVTQNMIIQKYVDLIKRSLSFTILLQKSVNLL